MRTRVGGILVPALTALLVTACSASSTSGHVARRATPTTSTPVSTTAAPAPTTPASTPTTTPATTDSSTPSRTAASTSHHVAARASSGPTRLPLSYSTSSADQVITVVAPSTHATVGTLQAWRRSAHGWRHVGPAVTAHFGSDGLSKHPSESRSATPIGSFTLTQAFGHDADPGTALPYTHTTPADWWISQPGALYNTRQHCASHCSFRQGDPNEHLYYETPFYDYAVVIDYNTANAPGGVRQGAGSAFFLHVTDGRPTAGCVSIAKTQLVRILQWLQPGRHPRILIGTA